jgi:hypothetical protein
MDDLIRTLLIILLTAMIAGGVVISAIVWLILRELYAVSAGDTGFIAASAGIFLLLCAGYIGTGLWLRRTGRI